jgi:serine/threonine protein phosphatase PrpC
MAQIQVTQLSPDDEFMVLATDGLWDYMTEEEVATFIRTAVQTRPREEVPIGRTALCVWCVGWRESH